MSDKLAELVSCDISGGEAEIAWLDHTGELRGAIVDLDYQAEEWDVGIGEGYCASARGEDVVPESILEAVAERAMNRRRAMDEYPD